MKFNDSDVVDKKPFLTIKFLSVNFSQYRLSQKKGLSFKTTPCKLIF
jgi:hypothetical protein